MSWSRVKMKAGLMIKGNLINHLSKLKLQVICTVGWKWIPRYVIDISFILCRVSSSIIFTCHSQDLFSHRETLLRVVGGLTISPDVLCARSFSSEGPFIYMCALSKKPMPNVWQKGCYIFVLHSSVAIGIRIAKFLKTRTSCELCQIYMFLKSFYMYLYWFFTIEE